MFENKEKPLLVFSIFSGQFFELPEKDYSLLNDGYIPMEKPISSSCRKCYGRGHTGRNPKNFIFTICNCLRRRVNFDLVEKANQLESKSPN